MHCNLRQPEPRQSCPALITTPYQVYSRWTLLILYAVTLTFDLEHLQCIGCDVMKLYTKFERIRAIRGGVIAISIDLMTLNMCYVLRSALDQNQFKIGDFAPTGTGWPKISGRVGRPHQPFFFSEN